MGEKNNKKVKRAHIPYTNRELSWLAFNERVLELSLIHISEPTRPY